VSPLGTLVAQAAEYTSGSQTLSLNNGMTVLTVGGDSYQLTAKYVTEDAGFYTSENSLIVVMLWKGNTLFGYCYDLQKASTERILLDSGVISLLSTGEGSSRVITGYTTSSGVKELPTLSQFKEKAGITSSGSTSNGSTGSDSTGNGSTSNGTTNNGTTNNGSTNNGSTGSDSTGSGSSSNGSNNSGSTNSGTYNVSLDGTSAYVSIFENGYYSKVKVAADSSLQSVGFDTLGSVYLYYGSKLKVWNYQLQKAETTKNLILVSSSCTGLAYKSSTSNEVAGYYENGKLQSLWSLDQIKTAISSTSTYVKWSRVITKGTKKYVQDSNNDTVCTAEKKGNKVYYNDKLIATGKKSNRIKSVGVSSRSKHYVLFRTAKHGCYVYNRSTKKWKKWRSDVAKFHYDTNGFIDKVKLTSGKYIIVTNT
jgi:hypothetical protein